MPDHSSNDYDRGPFATTVTDAAQGNAALLLVESLIHGLIARSTLSVQDAIYIIEIAADVERQQAETRDNPAASFQSVLIPLARSLSADLNG